MDVLFGILATLGDILAPTPAVRTFWAIFALGVLILAIGALSWATF